MSATKDAERTGWALETMAVAPGDRILEIGCGHGVAVSLICERLEGGRMTAIDRSAAMIERASHRNRAYIAANKVAFEAAALEDADLGTERFDKAFAINVRLFRDHGPRQAAALRRHLTGEGVFYLFQQHPSEDRTRSVTGELVAALERNGFTIREVRTSGTEGATMTCIVAVPEPGR